MQDMPSLGETGLIHCTRGGFGYNGMAQLQSVPHDLSADLLEVFSIVESISGSIHNLFRQKGATQRSES